MINFILHAWLKMLININFKFQFKYNNTFYLKVLMDFKCYEPLKFMFYFSFQYYKIIILCLNFFYVLFRDSNNFNNTVSTTIGVKF